MTELNDHPASGTSTFAKRFASTWLEEPVESEDRASTTMLAVSAGLDGVEPTVQARSNAGDEARAAAQWLLDRKRAGHAWRDMVIVAPGKRNWRDPIAKALEREAIPYRMLLGDKSLAPDDDDHVHVMTLYAVEGLEFPAVAVLGIGDLPWKTQTLEEAARLLYVAMTRATHALMISHSKPSTLVERLLSI